ncbi:MAG: hypothetical protein JW913_11385 [Chitinispirillaceae bacterium]|nr:hypothetical protein [Chitinispirillaceae bacterium]
MKMRNRFSKGMVVCCSLVFLASGSDSTTATQKHAVIALPSAVPAATGDATSQPDKLGSFSVLQKKYLRTVIITNALYAAGFGLYHGVVMPRSKEIGDDMGESMKLLPLNLLTTLMMYASLPMSAVTSYKARNNYSRYYNEKPRNFAMPLLGVGIGLSIGAVGVAYWRMFKDYRDNSENDGSYDKYGDLVDGLMNASTIAWAAPNLYSLVYIVVLGKKAEKNTLKTQGRAFQIVPFRCRGADGLMLSCEF